MQDEDRGDLTIDLGYRYSDYETNFESSKIIIKSDSSWSSIFNIIIYYYNLLP